MPNSIGKENKNIKAFFNWCFDKNITTRFSLKGYPTIMEDVDKNHITNFNKMIREICESLNMKDEIKFYREIAGKTIKVTKYKFEEVSSHTCRRTFCTLKFLKGMPAQAIMKFTGHTSERNFLKYLKLDAELTAKKYNDFF